MSEDIIPEGPKYGRRARHNDQTADDDAPPPPVKSEGWGTAPEAKTDAPSATGGPPPSGPASAFGIDQQAPEPPRQPRRRDMGWGSDSAQPSNDNSSGQKRSHWDDGDAVVPIVPDLEEELEEDITRQVAEAPKQVNRQVQSLSELNSQAALGMPSAASGIDLSLLTSVLAPVEAVEEGDEPWEFDRLLQQVSQEMQAEADKANADDDTA